MIQISSVLSRLGKAAVQKGVKASGTDIPYVTFTTTKAKVKLNSAALAALNNAKEGDFIMLYDFVEMDQVFYTRFAMTKGYALDKSGLGSKVGTSNIISAAGWYNTVLLNQEGVVNPADELLEKAGVFEIYTKDKKDITAKDKSGYRPKNAVRYRLEKIVLEVNDEEGEPVVLDSFSVNEKDGIEPTFLYRLVDMEVLEGDGLDDQE